MTTLFLGRLKPPMQLASTSCTYFCQQLTTALLESVEGETEVQSTLIISKSKGSSETLRDIRISTYQICRIEENTNQTSQINM